eukprot:5795389-Amphidinium_carterae.1
MVPLHTTATNANSMVAASTLASRATTIPAKMDRHHAQKQMENLKRMRRQKKNEEHKLENKLGSFYAKERKSFGVWRINGNVLQLVWNHNNQTDIVIAKQNDRLWVNDRTAMSVTVVEPENSPKWFKPDVLSKRFEMDSVQTRNFECPVCYFDLWRLPGGVIRHHSRRSCGHYFHLACAKYLHSEAKVQGKNALCPVCHSIFTEVQPLPDL